MNNKMTSLEKQAVTSLSLIMALRLIGLFMIVPIFSLYAKQLTAATPLLIGLAMGIYGITQALLQLPFGLLSDHLGRRPFIVLGLLLLAVGSIISALSHSIYGIIFGRALQGCGAMGSTAMAMMADLTREEQRSKAMAISGMTIGLSFFLAIMLGPLLAQWLSMQSLFWLTALLSLLAIAILYTWTPQPQNLSWHPETEPELKFFFNLLKNPDLLRLNSGIFFLHAIFTASFIALPISLNSFLGWPGSLQWKLYLPILALSFMLSLFLIILAEKQNRTKPYFISSIIILALAEILFYFFSHHFYFFMTGLCLFFTAFSILEAFLPSLVSRAAPTTRKGSAMGLYSCSQFLGIFAGGALGGWLYQTQGLISIFVFCLFTALLWLGIAYKMRVPCYLVTRTLKLTALLETPGQLGAWPELAKQLQHIPGIAEITFLPEEKVAYLKIERQALNHPDFLRIEQRLHHRN